MTLNLGVKWNPFIAMVFPAGDIYNFDLDRFYAGTQEHRDSDRASRIHLPRRRRICRQVGRQFAPQHLGSPRVGFAWDVSGDGRTSVRGSAGIARDFIKWDLHQNTSSVSPFRLTVQQANVSLDNPWATLRRQPVPVHVRCAESGVRALRLVPAGAARCQAHHPVSWNLGVQRQISTEPVRVGHLHRQPHRQPDERHRAQPAA